MFNLTNIVAITSYLERPVLTQTFILILLLFITARLFLKMLMEKQMILTRRTLIKDSLKTLEMPAGLKNTSMEE